MGISYRHADNIAATLRQQRERKEPADAMVTFEQFNSRLEHVSVGLNRLDRIESTFSPAGMC